ncbi:MAG: hypothetical protein IT287_05570 [Bdellovibrionaceae bacterium]|nr:hypothetical protein [Pseudobdellovibrionaceae bacterium]
MWRLIAVFFILGLWQSISYGQTATVTVTDLSSNSKSNYSAKLNFLKVEEDVKTIIAMVAIPIGDDTTATDASGNGVIFKNEWQKTPGKLVVGLGSIITNLSVTTDRGSSLKYKIKLTVKDSPVIETGCKKLGITASKPNFANLPLFIGVKCEKTKTQELLHMSIPTELNWENTSIFELAGKGERWKMFDLTQVGSTSSGVTKFNFVFKGKSFSIDLKRDKEKGKKQINPEDESFFSLRVGLGVAQLSFTTPSASAGATAPLIYTDIATDPYFWNVIAQSSLVFAMPLTGQQHYSFIFGTGPQFNMGSSKFLLLGEYTALGQEESESATSFTHSQMGVGLKLIMPTGSASQLSLHGSYSGLGGDSTHIGVRLHYEQKGAKHTWGGLFGYNMQTAKSIVSGNSSDFSQILVIGTYSF